LLTAVFGTLTLPSPKAREFFEAVLRQIAKDRFAASYLIPAM
jgi:hypothetical protein